MITAHRIPPPESVCPEGGRCGAQGASTSGGDFGKSFHTGHSGLFLMPLRGHGSPTACPETLILGSSRGEADYSHGLTIWSLSLGLQAAWMAPHTLPGEAEGERAAAGADRTGAPAPASPRAQPRLLSTAPAPTGSVSPAKHLHEPARGPELQ